MEMRRHTGDATRKNLAAFGDELLQKIWVFVIDRFDRNINPASRHCPISAAKGGAAFGGLRLHLFGFAMERVLTQERVVFLFLEPVRRARTFFVPSGHVARDRFPQRFCLGAFKSNDFLGHKSLFSVFGDGGLLFFSLAFAALVVGKAK